MKNNIAHQRNQSLELSKQDIQQRIIKAEQNKDLITSANKDCLAKGNCVAFISKTYPREVEALLCLALRELSELTSNNFKDNPSAIVSGAQLLQDTFPEFSLGEFFLFFKNVSKSSYGKTFGLLSIERIIEMGYSFSEEREEVIRRNKHNDAVSARECWGRINLQPLIDNFESTKEINSETKKEKSLLEQKVQAWIREFDELHRREQNKFGLKININSPIKFIKYPDVGAVDIDKFLEIKIEEYNISFAKNAKEST